MRIARLPKCCLLAAAYKLTFCTSSNLWAQDNPRENTASAIRAAYFPGIEKLKADEMHLTACGTGMPSPRPKQVAVCFLVGLGNEDKQIVAVITKNGVFIFIGCAPESSVTLVNEFWRSLHCLLIKCNKYI